ncbi:hypothetical protein AC579_9457 [Pseudocercospora musae]|uniref:Uncharacterized protein n=1 Tax=Pseudocercospora musae TaxID=113226 RepID=A0A139I9P8_9PEZI|nr:hypothetical protein AC579_9457 [Pseudocercospora musae]
MTGLLELPAELRIAIYELILSTDVDFTKPIEPHLLHTNRSTRGETFKGLGHFLAVKQQTLDFHQGPVCGRFYELISDEKVDLKVKQEAAERIHYRTPALHQRLAPLDNLIERLRVEVGGESSLRPGYESKAFAEAIGSLSATQCAQHV